MNAESDNGKYICFKATDNVWNVSYERSNQITWIDTAGPGEPTLSSPVDGYRTNNTKPTLSWTAGSIGWCSTLSNYEIQICSNSGCTSVVQSNTNAANTSWTLTTALEEGTYYWRVREKDSLGRYSEWTATRELIIDTGVPTCTQHKQHVQVEH